MKSKQKTGIRELASVFFILKIAENKINCRMKFDKR